HLVGLGAAGAADRRCGLQQLQRQHLGAATAVDHVELDAGPRTQRRDPVGQGRGMHVDALAVVLVDDESEALLGVVELHLPAWHVDTVLRRWCCGPLVALIADLSIPGWSSPVGWPGRTRAADDLAGLP